MLFVQRISVVSILASAAVLAAPAPVSDPVGIYAIIDRVELRPDATNPTQVLIWGVFARSTGQPLLLAESQQRTRVARGVVGLSANRGLGKGRRLRPAVSADGPR
jgi:hypothetical protein